MTQQNIGIWLDHRKAIIVKLDEWGEADITEVHSTSTSSGASIKSIEVSTYKPSWYRGFFSSILSRKTGWVGLNRYFELISMHLRDPDHVWIFGPGSIHHQLTNYLKLDGFMNVYGDILTSSAEYPGLMQIVDRVRDHYRAHVPFAFNYYDGVSGHDL